MTTPYIHPLQSSPEEPRDYVEDQHMSTSNAIILSEFITVMESL